MADVVAQGLYRRPTETKVNADGRKQLIDVRSRRPDYDGSCATEFAITRFLVPHLAQRGFALFMDSDMLVRANLMYLFEKAMSDPSKAVWCVKHDHQPTEDMKMDGQLQTRYARKNWSSLMCFDMYHPSNKKLTLEMVNTLPGRDLHAFCWLDDDEIGELDPKWNWLAGYSDPAIDPAIVHWTAGTPFMDGYENVPYADEGRAVLNRWAIAA